MRRFLSSESGNSAGIAQPIVRREEIKGQETGIMENLLFGALELDPSSRIIFAVLLYFTGIVKKKDNIRAEQGRELIVLDGVIPMEGIERRKVDLLAYHLS